jgi:hypothetical protein
VVYPTKEDIKMPKISVYHIREHPSLREPGGLQSFLRDHEKVKKYIRTRTASSHKTNYDFDLLTTLRKIDRIGENVNKIVDSALGKDISKLHPEAGRIRDEIAEFNRTFSPLKSIIESNAN